MMEPMGAPSPFDRQKVSDVHPGCDFTDGAAGCSGGVEDAGSIHVDGNVAIMRAVADFIDDDCG